MQKTIISNPESLARQSDDQWLGVEAFAGIGVTSEVEDAPVEGIIHPAGRAGWRAAQPGSQLIRITFNEPRRIRRINLEFRETEVERTQEFTLRASNTAGEQTEIVRQQWTFSPQGSTQEVEDYRVNLNDVLLLELTIDPDIKLKKAHASLVRLLVA